MRRINAQLLADKNTKSSAMPALGVPTDFPIVACLRTAPFPAQEKIITALKRILIAGVILRSYNVPGATGVRRAAAEIRLACDIDGLRYRNTLELPSGDVNLGYVVDLRTKATALQTPLASTSRSYVFLAALSRLIDCILQFRRFPGARAAPATVATEHPLDLLGTVEPSEVATEQAEAADAEILLHLKEPSAKPGDELSQEGFEASGLRTLYWLKQTESGVLWQRSRISPYEWPALQKLLASLPTLIPTRELAGAEALIAGLVAATALDPSELLSMQIGPNGDFTWAGTYHRKIPRPENAFDPPDAPEVVGRYEGDLATDITFDLPDSVQSLLRMISHGRPAQSNTLGGALGFDIATANRLGAISTQLSNACGELLRQHVNPRLRYSHLRLALRTAAYDVTRDPLLTYLIAGRPDLAPPVQMYYAAIPVERLIEVHRQVMRRLFGSP